MSARGDAIDFLYSSWCAFALGCGCNSFESNFLCAACDRRWEEHETFFETEETRRRGGRPYGEGTTRGRGSCQHL